MNQYMLVMRGNHDDFQSLSPAERQALMERYYAYVQRLRDENRFKSGAALSNKSRVLARDGGPTGRLAVTDGPFPDAKEALNGYFIIEAETLDEATQIGEDCPCLSHGETLEVIELTNH